MPVSVDQSAQVFERFLHLHNMPARLKQESIEGEDFKTAVSILQDFHIQPETVLERSTTSLYRQYQKESIDVALIDRLAVIFTILQKGIKAFNDEEDFKRWLTSQVPTLGKERPVDLLPFETGRREVEKAINRIEYNLYG